MTAKKNARRSAGLLLFRTGDGGGLEVLIGHMGGPFWAGREEAAWSVPKGEYEPDEEPGAAARREFEEEFGHPAPDGAWVGLGEARQPSGKTVTVWAVEADIDPAGAVPGTFTMEWPRGSGALREFPEMDRFAWCTPEVAAGRLVKGQRVFLDRLREHLAEGGA
ncbi:MULTISPECIES: NUDIX domain-containing protein [unclassified Streptomyces]|uniref:NUDIX domain-containing protein n=1 Tax=unclassified Streptomyces TaxID=2593676 RepID=UPI002E2B37F2|nr:NUDIX domain-containing protein [Streptomyces sp. NBC_01423]WSX89379.1 NUDIX domain-containing protein [Streptomyces sp. NBC_00891]WSY03858.1 NUDIX domain-containing protein [Streptomyces sp. NBC_00890]WSZ05484.1 NUDIX domain-containing protein [Streptomyces sp. NBC_00869]WSZ27020.1 NUDIX domain-containing protein [Streptomyces sp. NBC_00870]